MSTRYKINFVTADFNSDSKFHSKPDLFSDKKGHWEYFNKNKIKVDGNYPNAKFMQWIKD